jgi:hypothetical protein
VVISVLAGAAVLALLALDKTRLIRLLAVLAVTAVIWGWALAQYPLLLPPHLTIHDAAAAAGAGATELVVVAIIVVLVGPSFALLYRLAQHAAGTSRWTPSGPVSTGYAYFTRRAGGRSPVRILAAVTMAVPGLQQGPGQRVQEVRYSGRQRVRGVPDRRPTDMVTTPAFGTVPLNAAMVCSYTWECAPPPAGLNQHANVLGYGVIANTFLKTYIGLSKAG